MLHLIGAMTALAVIALSSFLLRALVRHTGGSAAWYQLGVLAATAAATAMPLIGTNLPAQMLEGASFTGLACLVMMMLPKVSLKELWGTEDKGKGKDK